MSKKKFSGITITVDRNKWTNRDDEVALYGEIEKVLKARFPGARVRFAIAERPKP